MHISFISNKFYKFRMSCACRRTHVKKWSKMAKCQAGRPLLGRLSWHLNTYGYIFVTRVTWHIHKSEFPWTEDWKLIWSRDPKGINMDQKTHMSAPTQANIGDPHTWSNFKRRCAMSAKWRVDRRQRQAARPKRHVLRPIPTSTTSRSNQERPLEGQC